VPLLVVPDGAGTLYGPAILAYDGSEGARHAIQVAGRLFAGRAAVVVHAWIPAFRSMSARGLARAGGEVREIVELLHEADVERAAATMQEGVDAARAAGLDAEGESIEADEGAWRAVAAAARAHGASVIVAGTRGLGAARSALVGSVSSGLVQNAEVPVLVVPSEAAASGDDRTS
jgi:nucleotide-binding universal stress UspA family protein